MSKLSRRAHAAPAVCAGILGLWASQASGERLVWLAPDRAPSRSLEVGLVLVGDDGLVRLPAGAELSSSSGRLAELPAEGPVRLFAVEGATGAVELEASLGGAAAAVHRVALGPPAARLAIRAEPASPVKGRDESVELSIQVLRGDGSPDPDAPLPVVRSSVGEIAQLKRVGSGRFWARLVLPKTRHPEVAVVVALAPWPHDGASEGAFGALTVPLASAVSLPGKTEAGAEIAVEIAGRSFGPARADALGAFEIPVVVPPGHRFGKSVTSDRAGNRRQKTLDLHLPPTDQIACVANPLDLPLDPAARARILCAATDPYGRPVEKAKLVARARLGRLDGPRSPEPGVYEWEYAAPAAAAGMGTDQLDLAYPAGGPDSAERLQIRLGSRAVARGTLEVSERPVFAGAGARLVLRGFDRDSRPAIVRPAFRARRGELLDVREGAGGEWSATYRAPGDAGDLGDEVVATLGPRVGSSPATIALAVRNGRLQARLADLLGGPVQGRRLALGGSVRVTDENGVAEFNLPPAGPAAVERVEVSVADRPSVRAAIVRLRTAGGERWFPRAAAWGPVEVTLSIDVAPAPPVDVRVGVVRAGDGSLAVRYRVTDLAGVALVGRAVEVRASQAVDGALMATGAPRALADGAVEVPVLARPPDGFVVSATDVETGVSASAWGGRP